MCIGSLNMFALLDTFGTQSFWWDGLFDPCRNLLLDFAIFFYLKQACEIVVAEVELNIIVYQNSDTVSYIAST